MNLTELEITAKIREALATRILDCPIDQVTDSALSNLDSIGRITLLVELENEFGVELIGQEFDAQIFTGIDKLAQYILSLKEKGTAPQ